MSDSDRTMSDLVAQRRDKLARLEGDGFNWPDRYEVNTTLDGFHELAEGTKDIRIAGRVVALRRFGNLVFGRVRDARGNAQFALRRDGLGDDYRRAVETIDRGDFIGIAGEAMVTRTGEKTLDVRQWTLLTKTLRPLPEKYHGVTDSELIMRKRYLEMITDDRCADRFVTRSRIIGAIRRFLEGHEFLEIDTPVLCNSASGAMAKSFEAFYEALGICASLRIAPETYLKRAMAGGFTRVFEFARCFRNEGIDPSHLPDFTMLEFYAAYWNYRDMLEFTNSMFETLFSALETPTTIDWRGTNIDLKRPWPVRTMREVIIEHAGIDIAECNSTASLLEAMKRKAGVVSADDENRLSYGGLVDLLFKKVCRPRLIDPVFIVNHPLPMSPLARRSNTDAAVVDRFQLVVGGWELVNAYSELIHPVEQRQRLTQQANLRAGGDEEAMVLDEDFLTCMEHGMPPMSGLGMGIDRLVALLTGASNLRDVIMFPLLKPV